jgi:hypothetical protein
MLVVGHLNAVSYSTEYLSVSALGIQVNYGSVDEGKGSDSALVLEADTEFVHTNKDKDNQRESNIISQQISSSCSPLVRTKLLQLLQRIRESFQASAASVGRYYSFAETLSHDNSQSSNTSTSMEKRRDGEGAEELLQLLAFPAVEDVDKQSLRLIDCLREKSYESHSYLKRVCDLLIRWIDEFQSKPSLPFTSLPGEAPPPLPLSPPQDAGKLSMAGWIGFSQCAHCGWTLSTNMDFLNQGIDLIALTKEDRRWTVLSPDGTLYFSAHPYSDQVRTILLLHRQCIADGRTVPGSAAAFPRRKGSR